MSIKPLVSNLMDITKFNQLPMLYNQQRSNFEERIGVMPVKLQVLHCEIKVNFVGNILIEI